MEYFYTSINKKNCILYICKWSNNDLLMYFTKNLNKTAISSAQNQGP
ncbi:hypothetical protein N499_0022 [Wolbachia pipientis wVitA]|nr:hypothetical protein N499_0022 [Wolbachia pipientis wVitA]